MSKQTTSTEAAKVEIFTTPFCAYCKMAKEYFRENNISYIEYDVSKDIAKQQEMIVKTHQFGVPVIVINGEIIIGFDRAKINQLLGI
jgi:glutaredoxin-like YruB-family protein